MCSTPQARPTSITPAWIMLCTRWFACWLLPHWVSIVVAATWYGRPDVQPCRASHVARLFAGLGDTAADDLPHRSWIDPGPLEHTDLRFTQQRAACRLANAPLRLPIAVRPASTMTGFDIGVPFGRMRRASYLTRRQIRGYPTS